MASLNIATDLALILFPIPMLWKMTTLNFQTKLQLTLLFLVGTIVVVITITRLPLIFSNAGSQTSRTLWASIEIVCASIVANAAFYYALWKEIPRWRGRQASPLPLAPYFLPLEDNTRESQEVWICSEWQPVLASNSHIACQLYQKTPKDAHSLAEAGLAKGISATPEESEVNCSSTRMVQAFSA
ncbi:hypothetical protein PRK78_000332 [Emydomyces testavorans]|uniref:Rhodopsin domain-containing protein n=1 Tax=Emydomyces testavorans TaxID=2070801 RepID=A0AAF0DB95_9EURO|nr:hypothetical protein PRK78_000332 [Emydomyces testavorans]